MKNMVYYKVTLIIYKNWQAKMIPYFQSKLCVMLMILHFTLKTKAAVMSFYTCDNALVLDSILKQQSKHAVTENNSQCYKGCYNSGYVWANSAFTFHSLQLRLSASAWSEQVWQSHWSGCRWMSLQGRGPLWTAPHHRTAKNWCAASPPLVAVLKKWRGSLSATNTPNQANTGHLVQLSRPIIILLPSYVYRFLNLVSVTQTYSCCSMLYHLCLCWSLTF